MWKCQATENSQQLCPFPEIARADSKYDLRFISLFLAIVKNLDFKSVLLHQETCEM